MRLNDKDKHKHKHKHKDNQANEARDLLKVPNILEQTFSNEKDLRAFVREFSDKYQMRTVISNSNEKAIYFICQHGGQKRSNTNNTRKFLCPFAMTAHFSKQLNIWKLKMVNNCHNHAQMPHKIINPKISEEIKSLYEKGKKPAKIELILQNKYPEITRSEIYNQLRNLKKRGIILHSKTQKFKDATEARAVREVEKMGGTRNEIEYAARLARNIDESQLDIFFSGTLWNEINSKRRQVVAKEAAIAIANVLQTSVDVDLVENKVNGYGNGNGN